MSVDDSLERRQLWRHMIQCILAEDTARKERDACPPASRFRENAEAKLLAKGVCLDAAIEALDDTIEKRRGVA